MKEDTPAFGIREDWKVVARDGGSWYYAVMEGAGRFMAQGEIEGIKQCRKRWKKAAEAAPLNIDVK